MKVGSNNNKMINDKENKKAEIEQQNLNNIDLNGLVALIPRKRKDNRNKLLSITAIKFLEDERRKGILSFPREHLNYLVSELKVKKRQKENIVNELIKQLIDNGLVKLEEGTPYPLYSFKNKPLVSCDYGSYNLMMSRNGYKRVYYNYERSKENELNKAYPIKKKIAKSNIGEMSKDIDDFDISEIQSYKAQAQQGVYSCGNMSAVREIVGYWSIDVYKIL